MESQNEEPKDPQNSSILLEEMVPCDIVEDSGNRELGGFAAYFKGVRHEMI